MRRTHRSLALRDLLASGGASRTALAERLGLSQMAVSRIVRDLMDAGLVEETGTASRESGPGRRQTVLQIREDGLFSAGIVMSAYSTEVAIVTPTGKMVARRSVRLANIADGEGAVTALAAALNSLIDDLSLPRPRIVGVGIAIAANLDPRGARIVNAGYLGWKPFNLIEPVAEATGLYVRAENISNALALAETGLGAARSMNDVVLVHTSTQVGASILQNGEIIRGQGFRAGRIGHFEHRESDLICSCGRNDCLNCSASGWSVLARMDLLKDRIYAPADVGDYATAIKSFADPGEPGAERNDALVNALQSAGSALAGSLTVLNQTIEPEAMILAGSLARVPDYVAGVRRKLQASEEGLEVLGKLRLAEIRAVRAAAILALMERIYSPELDFEGLCASVHLCRPETSDGGQTRTGTA